MNGKVLISGAGVAGLALAYWLDRAGFATTLVERSPEFRRGGQAVDIRGVALSVVNAMQLLHTDTRHTQGQKAKRLSWVTDAIVALLANGSEVCEIALTTIQCREIGCSAITAQRGRAHRLPMEPRGLVEGFGLPDPPGISRSDCALRNHNDEYMGT